MTRKEKVFFVLILFFLAALFLPWLKWVNVIAASLLGLYSLFYNSWREKWEIFKERKYVTWMFLFSLMVIISVLLSSNFHRGLRFLDPRLPLLYFPLSIGLLRLRREFKEKVLLGFALLTTFVVFCCLCWGIYRSDFFKKPEFLYSDSLTEILDHQSIYISLLVNMSIYIFAYHIIYKKTRNRVGMAVAILFLFAISHLLASRNLMVILYAFTIGFVFYYIFKQKKYFPGIMLLVAFFGGTFFVFRFFPKTLNRFKEFAYTKFNYENMGAESHYNMEVTKDQWNGVNFRLAVWKCGWELFLAHPIKGVDIGDKKDELMQKYREKNFQFALQTGKNVHSNYLDILYSMGIIGFGLFLTGWIILPLIYAKQYNDGLSVLIILSFAAAWITEIYFDRNIGGMLTGFFIPFLLTDRKK